MNFDGEIVINKAIVHILNIKDQHTKMSDYCIYFDNKLKSLIEIHIRLV